MLKQSPTYCSFLWQHVCARPELLLQPCCRFVADENDLPTLNEDFGNLDEALNSPFFQNLRSLSLRGETIPGCQKCSRLEALGLPSLRQTANSEFPAEGSESECVASSNFKYLEVFVGDTCNLKCLSCGPNLSTAWQAEYKKLDWQYKPVTPGNYDLRPLISKLDSLNQIKFVGGEPFLSLRHQQVLEMISDSRAQHMKLYYYTNVTVWPNDKVVQHWQRFASVEIILSVDGFGPLNDYLRFPAQWSVVDRNARKFFELAARNTNIRIGFNCTVSVFNIFSLNLIEDWINNLKDDFSPKILQVVYFNPLIDPDFMDIRHLPKSLKALAIGRLNQNSEQQLAMIERISEPGDPEKMKKLVTFIKTIDRQRGLDLLAVMPELKPLYS